MRIAIFSDTFFPEINGAANVAYQSALSLVEAGHQVLVCVPSKYSKTELQRLLGGKMQVVIIPSLPFIGYPGLRMTLPTGLGLLDLYKSKFRPEIIHSHTFFGAGWEALACAKALKIPLVGTHHTFFDHYLKHVKLDYHWGKRLSWRATMAYYNFCNLVISPSRSLGEEMKARGLKASLAILPNPINELFFRPLSSAAEKQKLKADLNLGQPALVYMGRVSYEKNIRQVLRAFAIFLEHHPSATLTIVGDGPERKKLEKISGQLGIKGKIIFTGVLGGPKLLQSLQANDIFITASKSENMPISVLEAMAVGLPIVAAAEKGLPEIVKEGVNGFLTADDKPEFIAAKIAQLADRPELLEKFSRGSQTEAAQYSKAAIIPKLISLYQGVIKK